VSWDDVTHVQSAPLTLAKAPLSKRDAYLIVLAGSMMGEMFKIGRERTIIGRGQKADIRMLDDGISREHCEIVVEGEKLVLHDLNSTNGTYCKGVRVTAHELADGDKILVGSNTVLKFTYHDKLDETFQRQMYESALRDDLTKAFNKKYFMDRVESEFAYALRHNVPLTLVAFDLDHFKSINDRFGHDTGDEALRVFAATASTNMRLHDVVGRLGGEEFAAILPGGLETAQMVAERVRAAFETRGVEIDGHVMNATVSIGISESLADVAQVSTMLTRADRALYAAKANGRNRACTDKEVRDAMPKAPPLAPERDDLVPVAENPVSVAVAARSVDATHCLPCQV
jgi:diguanylate cyclase (GGDEF)-like protein